MLIFGISIIHFTKYSKYEIKKSFTLVFCFVLVNVGAKMRPIVMDASIAEKRAAGNSTLSRNAFKAVTISASEKDERRTEAKLLP